MGNGVISIEPWIAMGIWLIPCGAEKRSMEAAKRFDLRKPSLSSVTNQNGSRPMGMIPTRVRSVRRWAVTCYIGPIAISTIGWNKITVASISAIIRCAGLEVWHQPHAFAVRSMKCASSFGSVPLCAQQVSLVQQRNLFHQRLEALTTMMLVA
jgi:hypothetical protein